MSNQDRPDGAEPPGSHPPGGPPRSADGESPDAETTSDVTPPPGDQGHGPRPGYGQPGYAASRGYYPPTPARSPLPFLIVGLLLLAVAAVVVVFLVTRGGAKPGAGDPVTSVRDFLSAIKHKDCGRARSYLTGDAERQAQGSCTAGELDRIRFSDPVLVHRSGTLASVSVKATTSGGSEPITLGLRRVGDAWLISDLNAD